MANIKSAIKRIEVAKRQTLKNKSVKSEIKTYIKKFDLAVESNNFDEAKELLKLIDKKLKRASLDNVIHTNAASRKTSQLQRKLNKASIA
ncbi:MAG: 30S ribosomal protein S20 [Tissierellia bacterium]|nr:30S ribosomal protein S20 [Tissierellia bacterium]